MAVLNTVASIIVYTPLILIGLTVLSSIGYAVWHYKYNTPTLGTLPPSYVKALDILKFIILKILTPVKWLLQFLWWLIPIDRSLFGYPAWRGSTTFPGYIPRGAWASRNLGRTGLFTILISIITTTILIHKYGLPDTIIGWSSTINITLISLAALSVFAIFLSFNQRIMSSRNGPGGAWPTGTSGPGLESARRNWMWTTSKSYLYYSIAVGLALALLTLLFYLVVNYTMFNVAVSTMISVAAFVGAMGLIYKMASQNPDVQNALRDSRFLSGLFYLIFIIPCLFQDTVKFIFNQVRHTPKVAYAFLTVEMLLIAMYIVIPIIKNYFYTLMPAKDDKVIILKAKIADVKNNKIILKQRIKNIQDFGSMEFKGLKIFGKSKQASTASNEEIPSGRRIDKKGWENIISNNLNDPKNEAQLQQLLSNYGYTTKDMCSIEVTEQDKKECSDRIQKTIKYIQKHTIELVGLRTKLKEAERILKVLEEEKRRVASIERSKLLLRDPVYLKNKRTLSTFEIEKIDNFDIEYNYNYALSSWFFIRAQSPEYGASYNTYTPILDYGGKPTILYNGRLNKLKIEMNNGLNNKPKTFIIDDFPVQKWTNIVINYDGGILDVFMNSKLLASFNNVVPYMSQDNITIGYTNGIGGGVCNVVYFPQSISKERIDINYNILSKKNPPVI